MKRSLHFSARWRATHTTPRRVISSVLPTSRTVIAMTPPKNGARCSTTRPLMRHGKSWFERPWRASRPRPPPADRARPILRRPRICRKRSVQKWSAAWCSDCPIGCMPTARTSTAGYASFEPMQFSANAIKPRMLQRMLVAHCPISPTRSSASTISSEASGSKARLRTTMTRRQRRLVLIGSAMAVLGVAVALMLNALRDSIVFFNSPSDVVEKHVPVGTRIRLGGLVQNGSLMRGNNLAVRFEVTDGKNGIPVDYQGALPDLFREGQGVVAEGALDGSGTFKADSILAKHDETYMPKEVADALKRSGHWKDDYGRQAGTPAGTK